MDGRAALQTQLHENDMVKSVRRSLHLELPMCFRVLTGRGTTLFRFDAQEFTLLEDDANVFKLVGPVLVKQDLQEARANVEKRMEYIKEELVRVDGQTKEAEKKLETQRNRVIAHQQAQQQARQRQQAGQ